MGPAYIRKMNRGHYFIIEGRPENHSNNTVVEECYTRLQAIRFAKRMGYDLIIKGNTAKKENVVTGAAEENPAKKQGRNKAESTAGNAEPHTQKKKPSILDMLDEALQETARVAEDKAEERAGKASNLQNMDAR